MDDPTMLSRITKETKEDDEVKRKIDNGDGRDGIKRGSFLTCSQRKNGV